MLKALLNQPLWIRVLRGLLLAAFVALLTIYTPTPFHVIAPGLAKPVGPMVTIQNETYPSLGQFLLPTVVSEKASLLYCIYGLVDPQATLVRGGLTQPQAQSPPGGRQMALSQLFSAQVALKAAGYDLDPKFLGLRVLAVDTRSPNAESLEPGDILLQVDHIPLRSFRDLKGAMSTKQPKDRFSGLVKRRGQEVELELEAYSPGSRPILGVNIRVELEKSSFPFDITFNSGKTVGASGGLVFALEIYDRLTKNDLTRGRIVAATGTLEPDGTVGPIEGVELKLEGAIRAGATVFLYPKGNLGELEYSRVGVEVIPVSNFNEALDALQK